MLKIIIKIILFFFITSAILITFINFFPKQTKKVELYFGITGIINTISNINKEIKSSINSFNIEDMGIGIFNSVNIEDVSKLEKEDKIF